ncbi:hypothetical protein BRC86_10750 [Halobacteriales archaeon QS_3_64_16]|nr:MAG: hypothetical protein BRC86_10750 [Halobacteriales archaeon QS_3_64_16]
MGGLSLALIANVLASATIGPVSIPVPVVARIVLDGISVPTLALTNGPSQTTGAAVSLAQLGIGIELVSLFEFSVPETSRVIVARLQFPRIVLGENGVNEGDGANDTLRAIGATAASGVADSITEDGAAFDTPPQSGDREDEGSERIQVGSDDTLLDAIERVLDERDGSEH